VLKLQSIYIYIYTHTHTHIYIYIYRADVTVMRQLGVGPIMKLKLKLIHDNLTLRLDCVKVTKFKYISIQKFKKQGFEMLCKHLFQSSMS
jgi:hypothetical protein